MDRYCLLPEKCRGSVISPENLSERRKPPVTSGKSRDRPRRPKIIDDLPKDGSRSPRPGTQEAFARCLEEIRLQNAGNRNPPETLPSDRTLQRTPSPALENAGSPPAPETPSQLPLYKPPSPPPEIPSSGENSPPRRSGPLRPTGSPGSPEISPEVQAHSSKGSRSPHSPEDLALAVHSPSSRRTLISEPSGDSAEEAEAIESWQDLRQVLLRLEILPNTAEYRRIESSFLAMTRSHPSTFKDRLREHPTLYLDAKLIQDVLGRQIRKEIRHALADLSEERPRHRRRLIPPLPKRVTTRTGIRRRSPISPSRRRKPKLSSSTSPSSSSESSDSSGDDRPLHPRRPRHRDEPDPRRGRRS